MKKIFLIIFALLILTSCGGVELNPEWYPRGLWKDDIFVSAPNGKFNIFKVYNGNVLSVNTDDNRKDTLLSFVNEYEQIGDKVYIYSEEGYCVIDEITNTAEILVTVEEQYALSGTNDPAVTYLKSFDDFSDKTKKIFKEMEEYWSDKEYRRYGSDGKVYPDGTIEYSNEGLYRLIVLYTIAQIVVIAVVVAIIRFSVIRARKNQK